MENWVVWLLAWPCASYCWAHHWCLSSINALVLPFFALMCPSFTCVLYDARMSGGLSVITWILVVFGYRMRETLEMDGSKFSTKVHFFLCNLHGMFLSVFFSPVVISLCIANLLMIYDIYIVLYRVPSVSTSLDYRHARIILGGSLLHCLKRGNSAIQTVNQSWAIHNHPVPDPDKHTSHYATRLRHTPDGNVAWYVHTMST